MKENFIKLCTIFGFDPEIVLKNVNLRSFDELVFNEFILTKLTSLFKSNQVTMGYLFTEDKEILDFLFTTAKMTALKYSNLGMMASLHFARFKNILDMDPSNFLFSYINTLDVTTNLYEYNKKYPDFNVSYEIWSLFYWIKDDKNAVLIYLPRQSFFYSVEIISDGKRKIKRDFISPEDVENPEKFTSLGDIIEKWNINF